VVETGRVNGELDLGRATLAFGGVTHVMAVINLSPESKNAHSIARTPGEALDMARRYRDAGVSIIDLGGQSSHIDNPTIAANDELARLLPALELLVGDGALVSVDTWKPEVARACVEEGAVLVNDTGGLADPEMRRVLADSGAAGIVMYVEGANPHDVGEIMISENKAGITAEWLRERLAELAREGIDRVIVDPGIAVNYRGDYGAYTRMQLEVIRSLDELRRLGKPILVPIPRKREDHRVAAYITMALEYGADIIRVHDVVEACDLVDLFDRTAPR
jgi:dihydropteroate synthase